MNGEDLISSPSPYRSVAELLHRLTARDLPAQILKRRQRYRPPVRLKADRTKSPVYYNPREPTFPC